MSTLLVASVGGHLTQLHRLLPTLRGIDDDRRWITFDTPHSRSLLADEDVLFVDYTGPRDIKNILRHSLVARRLFRGRHPYSNVVSTGSGIALSFLPIARLRGASCHYIESFTRTSGPSATGRVLSRLPGMSMYAQYREWSRPPWRYAGSVFDAFLPERAGHAGSPTESQAGGGDPVEIRRVVVTLGTMEDYSFRRLIERARAIVPDGAEVLWQVGCTDVSDLPIDAHRQIPSHELRAAMRDADVVIAHAGCGSSISVLEVGRKPVLVPREAAHGENVDDHQRLLASELHRRDLAIVRSVEELTTEDLYRAARASVRAVEGAVFQLS